MTLGKRLKRWRVWIGMTPPKLAAKCGVSPESVYQWESDTHEPTHKHLEAAAIATAGSLEAFWGRLPPTRGAA